MAEGRSTVAPIDRPDRHRDGAAAVPGDVAFEYFTKNELLESWLAAADVEAVEGGRYELFWEIEDRENNSTIGCTTFF